MDENKNGKGTREDTFYINEKIKEIKDGFILFKAGKKYQFININEIIGIKYEWKKILFQVIYY